MLTIMKYAVQDDIDTAEVATLRALSGMKTPQYVTAEPLKLDPDHPVEKPLK